MALEKLYFLNYFQESQYIFFYKIHFFGHKDFMVLSIDVIECMTFLIYDSFFKKKESTNSIVSTKKMEMKQYNPLFLYLQKKHRESNEMNPTGMIDKNNVKFP